MLGGITVQSFTLPIAPARLATVLFACPVITERVVAGASSSCRAVCVAGPKPTFLVEFGFDFLSKVINIRWLAPFTCKIFAY